MKIVNKYAKMQDIMRFAQTFAKICLRYVKDLPDIQCDHLQPCKKFLLITFARINYKGWKICHSFTKTITF